MGEKRTGRLKEQVNRQLNRQSNSRAERISSVHLGRAAFMRCGRTLHALCFFLSLLLCVLLASFPAFSQGAIDRTEPVSLTLRYQKNGKVISGAGFRIYRAASVTDDLAFVPEGPFSGYAVSWAPADSAAWKSLAETLSGYVKRDNVPHLKEGKTDANGYLTFSGNDMQAGLYLVIGDRLTVGRYTYTPEPFLISLPSYGEENTWAYSLTVAPKSDEHYHPPDGGGDGDGGTTTRKVLKVWNDAGNEEKRPQSVTVELLRDGKHFSSVELNAGNNWSHEWSGLDRKLHYEIVEQNVPQGYTVSVSLEGVTFVVRNSIGGDTPGGGGDTPGGGGDTPGGGGEIPVGGSEMPTPSTYRPEIPASPGSGGTASAPKNTKLPQTGVLWWPVPLLAGSGLLLYLIGWIKSRQKDKKQV